MATHSKMMADAIMYQEASAKCSALAREHAEKMLSAKTLWDRICHESDYKWMAKHASQYNTLQRRYRECSI